MKLYRSLLKSASWCTRKASSRSNSTFDVEKEINGKWIRTQRGARFVSARVRARSRQADNHWPKRVSV